MVTLSPTEIDLTSVGDLADILSRFGLAGLVALFCVAFLAVGQRKKVAPWLVGGLLMVATGAFVKQILFPPLVQHRGEIRGLYAMKACGKTGFILSHEVHFDDASRVFTRRTNLESRDMYNVEWIHQPSGEDELMVSVEAHWKDPAAALEKRSSSPVRRRRGERNARISREYLERRGEGRVLRLRPDLKRRECVGVLRFKSEGETHELRWEDPCQREDEGGILSAAGTEETHHALRRSKPWFLEAWDLFHSVALAQSVPAPRDVHLARYVTMLSDPRLEVRLQGRAELVASRDSSYWVDQLLGKVGEGYWKVPGSEDLVREVEQVMATQDSLIDANRVSTLADAYYLVDRYERSISMFEFLTTKYPQQALTAKQLLHLGISLRMVGEHARSLETLEAALAAVDDAQPGLHANILATYAYGLSEAPPGSKEEGVGTDAYRIRFYRKALELDPNHARALNNLAWVLVTSNEWQPQVDEALPHARRALERRPNDPNYLDTYARVLCAAGQKGEALSTLEHALRELPEDVVRAEGIRRDLYASYRACGATPPGEGGGEKPSGG